MRLGDKGQEDKWTRTADGKENNLHDKQNRQKSNEDREMRQRTEAKDTMVSNSFLKG